MSRTGPGRRRGETVVIEGPNGGVYAKTRKGLVYLRCYHVSGDHIKELELAARAASLFREVWKEQHAGDVKVIRVNLRDDHEPVPA